MGHRAGCFAGAKVRFLGYGIMELWRMRLCDYAGIEASTSLPLMMMVTWRGLDFAINCCFGRCRCVYG